MNPTLGDASKSVGGADVDLIIDYRLIDIKTTKKLDLTLRDFCQIVGYYLLSRLGGIDGAKDNGLYSIGIYFSRYDYLIEANVKDIIGERTVESLVAEFRSLISG